MKKVLLIISVMALISVGAAPGVTSMARITIINQSEWGIAISLTGENEEYSYYLTVPAGEELLPTERDFMVVRDSYSSSLYYIELWDPVYGYQCGSKSQHLDIYNNLRIVVRECDSRLSRSSEPPSLVKYGGGGGGGLIRLTIVNRSNSDVALSLVGEDDDNQYYFTIPAADLSNSALKEFTITSGKYNSTLYYLDLWDPVHGYSCELDSEELSIRKDSKVVIRDCERTISKIKDKLPGSIKIGGAGSD